MYLIAWKTDDGKRLWTRVNDETSLKAFVDGLQADTEVVDVFVFDLNDAIDSDQIE